MANEKEFREEIRNDLAEALAADIDAPSDTEPDDDEIEEQQAEAPDAAAEPEQDTVEGAAEPAPETEETAETESEPSEAHGTLAPPGFLNADEMAEFETMPDDSKALFLKQSQRLQDRYQQRLEGLTGQDALASKYRPLDELLTPIRDQLALNGVDEVGYVRSLVSADNYLNQNPIEALRWIAAQKGVDLASLNQQPMDDSFVDPEIKQLRTEIDTLKQSQAGAQQQQLQTAQSQALEQMTAFQQATDADGKLLHPHFETVQPAMAQLAALRNAQRQPLDLEQLYNEACWMNEAVRETLVAETTAQKTAAAAAEAEKKAADAQAAKVKRARAADTTVSSSADIPDSGVPGGSLRDDLRAAFEQAETG